MQSKRRPVFTYWPLAKCKKTYLELLLFEVRWKAILWFISYLQSKLTDCLSLSLHARNLQRLLDTSAAHSFKFPIWQEVEISCFHLNCFHFKMKSHLNPEVRIEAWGSKEKKKNEIWVKLELVAEKVIDSFNCFSVPVCGQAKWNQTT